LGPAPVLSAEHIPPWANQPDISVQQLLEAEQTRAQVEWETAVGTQATQVAADAVAEDIVALLEAERATNQAMNREHAEVQQPDDPHDWRDYDLQGWRPADVVNALRPQSIPPADWHMFEDRRSATGSSLDWVPLEMLNRASCFVTGRGVRIPAEGTGLVCLDGDQVRCVALEALRQWLTRDR
jgi:hypothetical protein